MRERNELSLFQAIYDAVKVLDNPIILGSDHNSEHHVQSDSLLHESDKIVAKSNQRYLVAKNVTL